MCYNLMFLLRMGLTLGKLNWIDPKLSTYNERGCDSHLFLSPFFISTVESEVLLLNAFTFKTSTKFWQNVDKNNSSM